MDSTIVLNMLAPMAGIRARLERTVRSVAPAGGFLAGLFVGFGWAGVVEGVDGPCASVDALEYVPWLVG